MFFGTVAMKLISILCGLEKKDRWQMYLMHMFKKKKTWSINQQPPELHNKAKIQKLQFICSQNWLFHICFPIKMKKIPLLVITVRRRSCVKLKPYYLHSIWLKLAGKIATVSLGEAKFTYVFKLFGSSKSILFGILHTQS